MKKIINIAPLPRWANLILLPIINLLMAFLVTAIILIIIKQNPITVLGFMIDGALGNARGIGYTLYYATTFIFTGLAVAVAFNTGLFNIGGEGQAVMGGIFTGLIALWLSPYLNSWLMIPILILAAGIGGGFWAFIPGYLKAFRGSHEVITTIMFNFIASSILVYLIVNWLKPAGTMSVESAEFADSAKLPSIQSILEYLGITWPSSPLNVSFLLAIACAFGVYILMEHTRLGYYLRAVGYSAGAATYAGVNNKKIIVIAMFISGALAGMVGINELAGVAYRLSLDYVAGAGFTGIAVALMGRNHPLGIVLASLLFGILFQGGAEVAFEVPGFTRNMVVSLQGFIVLFSGAMSFVLAPLLAYVLHKLNFFSDFQKKIN